MTGPDVVRLAALGVGGLQMLANAALLVRGPLRVRAELAAGALSERFADLLTVAWVYGTIANLCVSALLLVIATPLRQGNGVAWRVALVAAIYYMIVGVATFLLGVRRHGGLLALSVFGAALFIALWAARASYVR